MIRTAKAYTAAALTALGALLTVTTPLLGDGAAARWAYAVLAVLAALGITWRVPNADADHGRPAGGLLGVLDRLPALIGGLQLGREGAQAAGSTTAD